MSLVPVILKDTGTVCFERFLWLILDAIAGNHRYIFVIQLIQPQAGWKRETNAKKKRLLVAGLAWAWLGTIKPDDL